MRFFLRSIFFIVVGLGCAVYFFPRKVKDLARQVAERQLPPMSAPTIQPEVIEKIKEQESSGKLEKANHLIRDNVRYVLIEGKYYPYNPEGVYMVKGRRVFVQDNSAKRYEKEKDQSSVGEASNSLKDMLKNLAKAQKSIEDQNKALDDLDK